MKSKAQTKKSKTNKLKTKKTKKIKSAESSWPLQRRIFYRPERMRYIRKIDVPKGCVFCEASAEKISFETLCLYKTKYSMIVLNKFPYNSGHLLVLPLAHHGDLLTLSEDAYMDLQLTLKKAMTAIQKIYEPSGINMGMNHGAAAGAGIPDHLHYHLVPRWAGDLNFFPMIAETKVVVETLEQTYSRFIEYFKA